MSKALSDAIKAGIQRSKDNPNNIKNTINDFATLTLLKALEALVDEVYAQEYVPSSVLFQQRLDLVMDNAHRAIRNAKGQ